MRRLFLCMCKDNSNVCLRLAIRIDISFSCSVIVTNNNEKHLENEHAEPTEKVTHGHRLTHQETHKDCGICTRYIPLPRSHKNTY